MAGNTIQMVGVRMEWIIGLIVGGVGNRIRGGLVKMPGGTQVGRLVGWGVPMGILAWMGSLIWWQAVLIGLGSFVGCMMGQYGGLSMGHRGDQPKISPWLTMTLWGVVRVILPTILLAYLGFTFSWMLGAGLLCAPIYWLVWYSPIYVKGLGYGDGPPYDPPELAEAIHGAFMGAALLITLKGF